MKKIVMQLHYHDSKDRQKAMQAVSSLSGITSISLDDKDKKLTVVGSVDAVCVVKKLRKICRADVVSVGEDKKEEGKKEEKKEEGKKEEKKEEKDPKKEEEKMKEYLEEMVKAYKSFNDPSRYTTHYVVHNPPLDRPNCVIS